MNKDTDRHWLTHVVNRRLVFIMGKGGVGKTTVSVALAMAAVRFAKRVLIVEVGDCDAVGRIFNGKELPGSPRRLSDNIWGARVDPKEELEEYIHTHVSPAFIARRITRSRLFDHLLDAAPGLKEMMSLGRIWRWVMDGSAPPFATDHFDLVIVDAPATGHSLSLLRLPRQLIAMVRFGPLVSQMKEVQRMLESHEQTCLAMVTIPEELPVNETIEFYPIAANTLNMPVAVTFANMVFPSMFSVEEISAIKKNLKVAASSSNASCRMILETITQYNHLRTIQNVYLNRMQSQADFGQKIVEIPFYYTNALSIDDIRRISASWLAAGGEAGAAP